MNDAGPPSRHPFAPDPREDAADRAAAPQGSALTRFLGGAPGAIAARLIFLSLIVGFFLVWLDITPHDIFDGLRDNIARIWAMGFDALRSLAEYLVAGAAVVIPVFVLTRLLSLGRRG